MNGSAARGARRRWSGSLTSRSRSSETTKAPSGAFGPLDVSWASRAEEPNGKTSPEELIAAAWASCFAMALSHGLAQQGKKPQKIEVAVKVTFGPKTGGGFAVQESAIDVKGTVPGLDAQGFQKAAEAAKDGCPISQALKNNVKMSVQAKLS